MAPSRKTVQSSRPVPPSKTTLPTVPSKLETATLPALRVTLMTTPHSIAKDDKLLYNGPWYWIALGLAVPLILTCVFCALDSRNKKKKRKRKASKREVTIECLCEQNKLVPPPYVDVAHINEAMVHESDENRHYHETETRDNVALATAMAIGIPGVHRSHCSMHRVSSQPLLPSTKFNDKNMGHINSFSATGTSGLPRPFSLPQLIESSKPPVEYVQDNSMKISIVSDAGFGRVCSVESGLPNTPQLSPSIPTPPPYADYRSYSKVYINIGGDYPDIGSPKF